MPYAALADLVLVLHFSFVAFVAIGGLLAWRHPAVLIGHVPAVAWALGIVTVGWPCPLTRLENVLRERAGTDGYQGGFIDRYLTGVLYPERYEGLAQASVAALVVASYAALVTRVFVRRHRAWRNPSPL